VLSPSIPDWVNHRLESRVREIRLHGSEGGGAEFNRLFLPLSLLLTNLVRLYYLNFARKMSD